MKGFAPRWITEVELARPLADQLAPACPTSGTYAAARVLVRVHGQPLGTVAVSLRDGVLAAADVLAAVRCHLAAELHAHVSSDYMGEAGLPSTAGPRCLHPGPHGDPAPSVTVIVCTRDRPDSLARLVESLVTLDYPDMDVVVVDNAPRTTSTFELVAAIADPRIRYVVEPRAGLSCARNTGARHATGRILAFTDDDVVVDAQWLGRLARAFTRAPRVGCVTGLVLTAELETPAQYHFDGKVNWGSNFRPELFDLGENRRADPVFPYGAGQFGTGANFATTPEALAAVGGFDEALGAGTPARGGEDLDFFARTILEGFTLAYEPGALVWHSHRRDHRALRRQMYGYGTGLSAYAFKQLLSPGTAADIGRRVPRGVARFATTPHFGEVGAELPRRVRAVELFGLLAGPVAYLRGPRTARAAAPAPPPRRLAARARAAAADPLARSSWSLMASTVLTTALGLAFWVAAARMFPTSAVGRDGALIASMMTLSQVCQLNLNTTLARFLPRAGLRTRNVVLGSYGLSAALSLVLAVAFVLVTPHLSSKFAFLSEDRALAMSYVASVVLWTVFALQDAVLTGLRRTPWVPVENAAFGVLKLAGLVLLAGMGAAHGVFVAWAIPVALLLVPVNWLIFARAIPRHIAQHARPSAIVEHFSRRRLLRFLSLDYVGTLIGLGVAMALPLLVLALLGTHASAFFYIPFTLAAAFELLFGNVVVSLTVEGAFDETRMVALARRVARRLAAVALAGAVVFVVAAPLVLLPFGTEYAHEGSAALRLFGCALLFRAAAALYIGVNRLRGEGAPIFYVAGTRAVLLLGLALALAGPMGLTGVALAWLISSAAVTVVVFPSLRRFLRDARPAPGATPPERPAPAELPGAPVPAR